MIYLLLSGHIAFLIAILVVITESIATLVILSKIFMKG